MTTLFFGLTPMANAAITAGYNGSCCTTLPHAACCESGAADGSDCVDQTCGPTAQEQGGTCRRQTEGGQVTCVENEVASTEGEGAPEIPVNPPLSINIPTIRFSNVVVNNENGNRTIDISWLAEYISGMFRYAIPVAAVLAVVMMMIGGLQWLTSAGDSGRVGAAKKRIIGAAIGLALLLGSYLLLYTINPNLVSLRALRIETVIGDPYSVPNTSHEDPDPDLVSRLPSNLQVPTPPSDLVDVRRNGMAISLVNPAIVPHLEAAAANFVSLRTNASWTIRGQCWRPAAASVAMYLKRCLYRSDCDIPTGSVGLTRNGTVIRENGRMVPADPRFRNLTLRQIIEETRSAHINEWGATALDLYQFLNERALATGGGHASALACDIWCQTERVGRFQESDIRCQVILERAMKQAGWGRLNIEYWHFEHPDTSTSRTVSPGFSVGAYTPFAGTRCISDESVRRKVINYGQLCPNGLMIRAKNPCRFTCDGRPMIISGLEEYCQAHRNECL
ncbi:hypothetical protein A2480_02710 [Candidatus Uhrbacteria bacterium RIFOXYC2_FULL_47_19]|uniref:Peptidase M15B domain-containing protein n=1 Tax=Candidatus Uhrbacteria bacterium RIFOXYC2_FULL_47_19 TaxID=1802424 RepID=A0A1F7WD70_9BACT|nr:MAG: hypothetical protein A2480_02710 [Candidatus Uhrbacteria bacterium RIFOXYC2_FULL_47_19]